MRKASAGMSRDRAAGPYDMSATDMGRCHLFDCECITIYLFGIDVYVAEEGGLDVGGYLIRVHIGYHEDLVWILASFRP